MDECSAMDALSEILMEVPDLVFAFSCDGRYMFINRAASAFLGADPLEVIGYHWSELGYPDSVMEPLMTRVDSVFDSEESQHYRAQCSPLRGSRVLDLSLTPLRCSTGGISGVLVIGHDIHMLDGTESDRT